MKCKIIDVIWLHRCIPSTIVGQLQPGEAIK